MRTAARLHGNEARGQLAKKIQDLRTPQFLAQNCSAHAVSSMHLKHILRQIEPDRDNL